MSINSVVVLNQFALPLSEGGGTRHVELFGQLDGWDSTVLAGSRHYFDQHPVASEGVLTVVPVTKYNGNGIDRVINWGSYCGGALYRASRLKKPTLVYGSSPHLGAALVGRFIAKARRVPFVLEVRDLWPQILVEAGTLSEKGRVYKVLKGLEQYLYDQADAIVVLAEGSIPPITAMGIDRSKIHFIPNGADPESFDVDASRDELRKRHEFDKFTIVYAGAHGPANGLDLVLNAASELQETHPNVQFVLYGDGVAKAALVERAKAEGLTSVEFRDPVAKSAIPEIFCAADVGLHCLADVELFKSGISPNKLYDYMAAGLPAITNTGGDTAALIRQAGGGIAVGSNSIADGVVEMVEMGPEKRAEHGRRGRAYMAQERSRRAMATRLEALLDSLA